MKKFNPALRRVVVAGALVLAITLGLRSIAPGARAAPDFAPGNPGRNVIITVAPGASGSQIARTLFEAGVVKSQLAFFRVAVADSRSASISAGDHRIQRQIPAREALAQLLDADRIVNLIRIRDGARLAEIIDAMEASGYERKQILAAIGELAPPELFKTKNIEGFLYPALYAPQRNDSAGTILGRMLKRFDESTKSIDWNYANFTPYEILIVASLIEAEGTPDVFTKVAKVIYNRLDAGMPLQLDATVHYALGKRGEIALSIQETKVNSRYNTYRYPGLPPGPIGSPTIAAIKAALTPADGEWRYYVTVAPGETRFTDSYDEFLRFKSEYKKNLKAGRFE